jgi:hypothetical protein
LGAAEREVVGVVLLDEAELVGGAGEEGAIRRHTMVVIAASAAVSS